MKEGKKTHLQNSTIMNFMKFTNSLPQTIWGLPITPLCGYTAVCLANLPLLDIFSYMNKIK